MGIKKRKSRKQENQNPLILVYYVLLCSFEETNSILSPTDSYSRYARIDLNLNTTLRMCMFPILKCKKQT